VQILQQLPLLLLLLLCVDQMLDYNVPGGKLNRGMAVYDVLVSIKGAEVSISHQSFNQT
jgi:ATP-dependent protease ClpP protease subunit